MIPKVINYCWFGGKEKPDNVIRMIESWATTCPDFVIKEWNESNYDIHKHPFMERALADGKWSFVSDYARLDVMYKFGGIYLDTDVEVIKDLSPLCEYKGYFGFENDSFVNDGHGFGCEPGLEIIRKMRDIYDELVECEYIESPRLRTEVLVQHGLVLNGARQRVNELEIFPVDFFCPKSFMTGKILITDNTYSIHYYDSTWKSAREIKYVKFNQMCCRMFGEKAGHQLFEVLVNFKDQVKKLINK